MSTANLVCMLERLVNHPNYLDILPGVPELIALWQKQNGKCAVTGLDMVTDVASSPLHVGVAVLNGETVLVCQAVVYLLAHYEARNVIKFLDAYADFRIEHDGYRHHTSFGEYIPESL